MKRMVDEKDRKKLSELTEADIEKLQGLHLYEHNITVQVTVDNDEVTEMYGHLTILNTTADEFTVSTLTNYLKDNFDTSDDYNKLFTASGKRNYTGISYKYESTTNLAVQCETDDIDITAIDIYSDCVIQIF